MSCIVEAANGVGKTVSVLLPSTLFAIENGMKLLYFTRTKAQLFEVLDELRRIRKKIPFKMSFLLGRRDLCVYKELKAADEADYKVFHDACRELRKWNLCPFYKDEGCNIAIDEKALCRPVILVEVCKTKRVCPYEVLRSEVAKSDVLVTLFPYVLNPLIRKYFFRNLTVDPSRTILVLDEAHNIPRLVLENLSDSVSLRTLERGMTEAGRMGYKSVEAFLRKLAEKMVRDGKVVVERGGEEVVIDICKYIEPLASEAGYKDLGSLVEDLLLFGEELRNYKASKGQLPLSYLHRIGAFLHFALRTSKNRDYAHLLCVDYGEEGGVKARLEVFMLSGAGYLRNVLSSVYSSIFVSGTILSMEHFSTQMGLASYVSCEVEDPYRKEQLLVLTITNVSTKFDSRSDEMYDLIGRIIVEAASSSPANIGAFFPSYDVLSSVLEKVSRYSLPKELIVEERGQKSHEVKEMIQKFKATSERGGALLLGVMGGKVSEGVNFAGNAMNTVIVVGFPADRPSERLKLLYERNKEVLGELAKDATYVIPAAQKAVQTAGRAIRSLLDRKAVLFLDGRYCSKDVVAYFPKWLKRRMIAIRYAENSVARLLKDFFGYVEDSS